MLQILEEWWWSTEYIDIHSILSISNDDNDNRWKIRMKTLCTLHTIFALNISQQKTIIKIHTFV